MMILKDTTKGTSSYALLGSLLELSREALCLSRESRSAHLDRWRRHAVTFTGATLLSLAMGGIAVASLCRMREHAHKHKAWKRSDTKLDAALEHTMDGSDAVAKY